MLSHGMLKKEAERTKQRLEQVRIRVRVRVRLTQHRVWGVGLRLGSRNLLFT